MQCSGACMGAWLDVDSVWTCVCGWRLGGPRLLRRSKATNMPQGVSLRAELEKGRAVKGGARRSIAVVRQGAVCAAARGSCAVLCARCDPAGVYWVSGIGGGARPHGVLVSHPAQAQVFFPCHSFFQFLLVDP